MNTGEALFAAGAVFIAIPITLLFMYLQRRFVHGLSAGATKGWRRLGTA